MSTVADYIGRTVDVLAFQGKLPSASETLLTMSLVGDADAGAVVTGIQKLAQRTLLILLTRQGSLGYYASLGTTFITDAQAGTWRTTADVELSFYAAKLDLVRQLRAQELDTDPDDERIDTIALLGASLQGDFAAISLQLTSLAGAAYTFIAPIPLLVR